MNVNDNIYITQKANNANLFIYTNVTKQSHIDVSVDNVDVNTFSLFGFSMDQQIVYDSNINISIYFQVLSGALLCTICDIDMQRCTLVFIASGLQISGMIIEPKESINIQQSFIQFRISSMNSSGLTNIVKQSSVTILICQCKLAGSNQLQSKNNGYIASALFVNILLNITQFVICVDQTPRFGQDVVEIRSLGYESVQCDVCDSQYVVYGLCGEMLEYSENINGIYQCVHPFEYIDSQCKCASGYLLNNSKCIDVVESINIMSNLIRSSKKDTTQLLDQVVENVENKLILVDQHIQSNITEVEQRIISNFSQSEYNLMMNISTLDNRIYQNISLIKNDILAKYITADTNLLSNTTVLDWRIFNNVSILNTTLNTSLQNMSLLLKDFNNSLQSQHSLIEQQQNIINNLTQQINCTSNQGFSMKNGSCVQVSCAISGQQSINGICQCTIINSIVYDDSCVCPVNSNVQGTACVCSISGQTMLNGQCVCPTTGAFVYNNACTCGLNSLNISNTCSCPGGASLINGICICSNINAYISGNQCMCPANSSLIGNTCTCPSNSQIVNNVCICNQIIGQIMIGGVCKCLTTGAFVNVGQCSCGINSLNTSNTCSCPSGSVLVNGACTCSNVNAYISGDKCVCPTFSSLVGNTCTCPSNSQIVGNECVCNLISGQVMNNGVCKCKTANAYVNNGACVCGVDALNVSNVCTCPPYSSLINNVCACDQITGQQMISGSCQCQFGYSIVNNSCYQTSYVINITQFVCSQEFFSQQFDIQDITNQISTPSNFSAGYVFSVANIIQNAFVDVYDNVYSTFYPLFQSQSSFTNLKIQFGTQTLGSGSLILSSSSLLNINQMNIISKLGSQLTVDTLLNIFTSSTTSANITKLLVNLTFAPSSGTITLISNINNVFTISEYQILGSYVSTGTVAMVGVNLNSANVNVNQIRFQPTAYNVGNCSSYLFGQAVTTASSLIIKNFAIIIGDSSNYLLLGSISTTSIWIYYQFGGIIAYINSASIVNVNNLICDSFQKLSTGFVVKTGLLVGFVQQISSNIALNNVCLQQNITSTSQKYQNFGVIGWNYGNISIQSASTILSILTTANINCFGIIGQQHQQSLYAEVINLRTSVNFSVKTGSYIGSIFGAEQAVKCFVLNTTIFGGNISSSSNYVGCFSGNLYQNATLQNSTINQMIISGAMYVGGLVGLSQGTIYLVDSKIQSVRISGPNNVGIILGSSSTVFFSGSSSASIYINEVLKTECAVLSNWQNGC
ncbi:Conserved_hypothetical protein [Hexamita inflata]|uniref:Uncharacterized protein n=1 Tax=Hexamita inflata TaxID=28002 RepID=A0AA86TXH4_9EUKA|nr:Conserved hypothetical protein [Hexamita inflata]